MPVVGFLSSGSPRAFGSLVSAFRHGLADEGFVEGRNVRIDYRWAEGNYDDLGRLTAELIQNRATVIAATGGLVSAKAAMKATTTIPIVFIAGFDPVQLGLVKSLSRPEGNVTGASVFTTELAEKRFELLYRLVGPAGNFGLLVNPGAVSTKIDVERTKAAAARVGRPVIILEARSEGEIDRAFASAAEQRVNALVVHADPFFTTRRAQIVALAGRYRMPAAYPWREYTEAGGLLSYGTELSWGYQRIGVQAGRILKGAKPSQLPVELPTEFQLVINMKTAKQLGIAIPPEVRIMASETIP
jgi:putative tryptophan/tyrosine transport system substrate-binding protein